MEHRSIRVAGVLAALLCSAGLLGTSTAQQPGADDTSSDEANALRMSRDFDFGAFCIANIPVGTVTSVGRPSYRTNGVWREITLTIKDADEAKPTVHFLSGIPRIEKHLSACGKNLSTGVVRVLEGKIANGTVRFDMLVKPYGDYASAQEIEPGGLDIVVTKVQLQFAPLYGGRVSATSLKVTNVDRFVANAFSLATPDDDVLSGVLRVGSRKLSIVDAKVQLPGTTSRVVTTFSAGREGASFLVQIPSGAVQMDKGVEVSGAAPLVIADTTIATLAGATISGQRWQIGRVQLTATGDEKPPTVSFSRLSVDSDRIEHSSHPRVLAVPGATVSIEEVAGLTSKNGEALIAENIAIKDLNAATAALQLGGNEQNPAISGAGSLRVRRLTDSEVDGEFSLATPDLPALNAVARVTGNNMKVQVAGNKQAPRISGDFNLAGAALGSLGLRDLTKALLSFRGVLEADSAVGLPFSVDASTPLGQWSFTDGSGGMTTLEGQVKTFRAKGTLRLAGGDVSQPMIAIDPGAFALQTLTSAVRQSLLFGAAPEQTTLSATLSIGSTRGFSVSKEGAVGAIEVTTDVLALNEPQLVFNAGDEGAFRVRAPLKFEGGAAFAMDLASSQLVFQRGRASISKFSADAVDPSQAITIGDIEAVAPSISIGELAVNVASGAGTLALTDLALQASSLKHAEAPAWSATQASTSIGTLSATLGPANRGVQLNDASLASLHVKGKAGSYTSTDGFHVDGKNIAVDVDQASLSSVVNASVAIESGQLALNIGKNAQRTRGSAGFTGFLVKGSGTGADINGTLSLQVQNIDAETVFPALPSECPNDLLLALDLRAGAFALSGKIEQGAASGRAVVSSPRMRLHKTSNDVCEFNKSYTVSVMTFVPSQVCDIPLIGDAVCHTVNRAVPVSVRVPVRWRAQAVVLDLPVKSDDVSVVLSGSQGASVCVRNARMDALGKGQIPTLTPTFEAHGELANAVKSLADLSFQTAEGLLIASVATSVTNIASLVTALFPVDYCG